MHNFLFRLIGGVAMVLLTAAASAQSAAAWQFDAVPAARQTVVVLAWQHGFDDDADAQHGLARVLAECRLLRARLAVPAVSDAGVLVLKDVALTFAALPAKSAEVVAFATALLDEALELSDDSIARQLARAALLADDAEWLYPGLVFECRARALMFAGQPAGRPVAGSATALQACTVAQVRERLRRPVGVSGHVFGAPVHGELPPLPAAAPRSPVDPAPPVAAEAAWTALTSQVHSRVDGPFVAAAFRWPAGTSLADQALALEVARVRAARQLRLRGGEAMARSPLVGWSWRAGGSVVVFARRGHNGDAPEPAQRELQALLDDLRHRPPTARELTSAANGLAAETAMPPWSAEQQQLIASSSGALVGRALVAVLVRHRGLQGVDFGAATAAQVHAALRQGLPEQGALWLALVPVPSAVLPSR